MTEGRPINPSTQTSPGSMVNQYKFEEEEEEEGLDDTKDLFITVDNPESHVTAVETFITYRVLTKVRNVLMSIHNSKAGRVYRGGVLNRQREK